MTASHGAGTVEPGGLPEFAGLHHVGYSVPDLEQAVAFFTDVLGFSMVSRGNPIGADAGDSMTRVFGVHARASARMVFVRRGALTVELIAWASPEQRATPPINSDIGASHLALAVTNLPRVMAHLRAQPGVRVLEPSVGETFAYVRTPWGMLIQLMAPPRRE